MPIFVIGRMNEAGLVADYRQVARPVLAVFLTNPIGVIGFVFRTYGHTNSGCQFAVNILGDAENARHELAGHENAAPCCRGGKCET